MPTIKHNIYKSVLIPQLLIKGFRVWGEVASQQKATIQHNRQPASQQALANRLWREFLNVIRVLKRQRTVLLTLLQGRQQEPKRGLAADRLRL